MKRNAYKTIVDIIYCIIMFVCLLIENKEIGRATREIVCFVEIKKRRRRKKKKEATPYFINIVVID